MNPAQQIKLINEIRERIEIGEKDLEMTTEPDWYSYHEGAIEALKETLELIEALVNEGDN
jgi:hypothetical protein